jgi:transposase
MLSAGASAKTVASDEGVSPELVYAIRRRFSAQDYGISKPGRGRHIKLDERDKRRLLRVISIDPFVSLSNLAKMVSVEVSTRTLGRALERWGIKHTLAASRPYLTEETATRRYRWALQYINKPPNFWHRVLFTDESTVDKSRGGKRKWVFRPYGKTLALLG